MPRAPPLPTPISLWDQPARSGDARAPEADGRVWRGREDSGGLPRVAGSGFGVLLLGFVCKRTCSEASSCRGNSVLGNSPWTQRHHKEKKNECSAPQG